MNNSEFKFARLSLGLTQLQLAERLGMTSNSIARIERGQLPLRKVVSLAVLYLKSELEFNEKPNIDSLPLNKDVQLDLKIPLPEPEKPKQLTCSERLAIIARDKKDKETQLSVKPRPTTHSAKRKRKKRKK